MIKRKKVRVIERLLLWLRASVMELTTVSLIRVRCRVRIRVSLGLGLGLG
jgi:hypothetical protein